MLRLALVGGTLAAVAACSVAGGSRSVVTDGEGWSLPDTTAIQDRTPDTAAKAARGGG
ncbi:hypothetical protein BH24ACT7_BH24ACT7_20630 [soil metagenome]